MAEQCKHCGWKLSEISCDESPTGLHEPAAPEAEPRKDHALDSDEAAHRRQEPLYKLLVRLDEFLHRAAENRELHEEATALHREVHDAAFAYVTEVRREQLNDDQIKYMADRFLGWRLPANFSPDAGISFTAKYTSGGHPMKHEPAQPRKVLTRADIAKTTEGHHRCGWDIGPVKNLNPACGCMCGTVYNEKGQAIIGHYPRHSGRSCKCFRAAQPAPQPASAEREQLRSAEEYQQLWSIVMSQGAMLAMLPIHESLAALERADTVAPMLDPTLYRDYLYSGKGDLIKDVLRGALAFTAAIRRAQAQVEANPRLLRD